jgi:hypothetical protein
MWHQQPRGISSGELGFEYRLQNKSAHRYGIASRSEATALKPGLAAHSARIGANDPD